MESDELKQRAASWLDAWNRRDLEKLLPHYAEDVELHSPFVAKRWDLSEGKISGKEKLREHFSHAFETRPENPLVLADVLAGVSGFLLIYKSEAGALCADQVELNVEGKVTLIKTYYSDHLMK